MAKDFEDILSSLLSKSGIPDVHTKLIRAIGYEIFKKYFDYWEKGYNEFFSKIEKDPELMEKFDEAIRFYYFWCKRPSLDNQIPSDFKLIVIFSIMENMVADNDYILFSDWLKEEIKNNNIKITTHKDVDNAVKKYHELHGSRKKVATFFNNYYPKEEKEKLLSSLKTFDDESDKFIPIKGEQELFEFVEGIRHLFIHRATYIQIKSLKEFKEKAEGFTHFSSETLTVVNGRSYAIDDSIMHIEALLEGFEKSLLNFFQSNLPDPSAST